VVILKLKLLLVFKPAGLTVSIFYFALFVHSVCSSLIHEFFLRERFNLHLFFGAQFNPVSIISPLRAKKFLSTSVYSGCGRRIKWLISTL
jgi:hypothetical protein